MIESLLYIIILGLASWLIFKSVAQQPQWYAKALLLAIAIEHCATTFFFIQYNVEYAKDALQFYDSAKAIDSWAFFLKPGTLFMSFIIYPLVKLNLSIVVINLLFSLLGLYTFLEITNFCLKQNDKLDKKALFLVFLLLPSYHFWVSGFTKETVLFFAFWVLVKHVYYKKYTSIALFLSLLLLAFIRPYYFMFAAVVWFIVVLMDNQVTKKIKKQLAILVVVGLIIAIPLLLHFFKLTSFSFEVVKQNYNILVNASEQLGNSSISLNTTNYLERLLIVVGRPFFFDAVTIYQYVISVENFICIILILLGLYSVKNNKKLYNKQVAIFIGIVVTFNILFLSIYMYNLGLAARMRMMLMPWILFAFYLLLHEGKKLQYNN